MLQVFWGKLKAWYETKFPDRKLTLTCTHRSVEEQQAIFKQNEPGKILTHCDGVIKKSKHNYLPAQAFDVAVIIDGKAQWQEIFYIPMLKAISELGYSERIRAGGNFSFRDWPHLEAHWPGVSDFYGTRTEKDS